ncbi:telomerase inhibitor [Podospora bellae-mahoneyi]|uniref:PinX1-related protein 1 n=1 Tax=Podospora bellae-mahoneyi TaxID=2093777 RepID=A0ABR0FWG1_9PEZI|nr:telomerase inhibitor [Podospora bellae-mahoneyi]
MGLAGAKNKRRLGNDPNNNRWMRNTESFGQKMLRSQGWEPGQYLGAKDAAHAENYGAASASHIQVTLKDDTLGLGAKRNNGDECTGLFDFQHLLGRLNGKSEEALESELKKREDLMMNSYLERRLGTIRFVRGGWLVGDVLKKEPQEGADKGEVNGAQKSSEESTEESAETEASEPSDLPSKKRKADEDTEKDDEKARKKEKKSKKRKTESDVETDSAGSKEKKDKKSKKRKVDSAESDTEPAKSEKSSKREKQKSESPEEEVDTSAEDAKRAKKEKKKERKEKKEKKEKKDKKDKKKKDKPVSESGSEAGASSSKEKKRKKEESVTPAVESDASTPTASGYSTPVTTNTRYLARSRFIAQKKMAFADSAALNQIFMIKS